MRNRSLYIKKPKKRDYIMYAVMLACMIGSLCAFIGFKYLPNWAMIILYVVTPLLALSAILFSLFGFEKTHKILVMVNITYFVFALIYLLLSHTGFMDVFIVPNDCVDRQACISENMKNYLESKGKWSTVVFIAMQFLQTTILPIPSFVLTGAGTMIFSQAYGNALGPILNSVYSLIGIVAGSLFAFFIGRKYGVKLVVWIVGKESLIHALKLVKGKDIIVLTLMFLLPFFPDDILCFVAGLSSMSISYFIVMMTISRVLVVVGSSYLINLIPFTTWWGILIWLGFVAIVVIAFYYAVKYGDKIFDFVRHKIFRVKDDKKKDFDFADKLISELESQVDEEEKAEMLDISLYHKGRKR